MSRKLVARHNLRRPGRGATELPPRFTALETTAALVAQHGLRSASMSQMAEETGIGRARPYEYFTGIEQIQTTWHERHLAEHLERLNEVWNRRGDAGDRLEGSVARRKDDGRVTSPIRRFDRTSLIVLKRIANLLANTSFIANDPTP